MRAALLGAIGTASETEQTIDFSGGAFPISIPISIPSFATVFDMYMISPGEDGDAIAGPYGSPGGRGGSCAYRLNFLTSGLTQVFVNLGRDLNGTGFAEVRLSAEAGPFACYAVTGSSAFVTGSTVRLGGAGGISNNSSNGGGGGGAANTTSAGGVGQFGSAGGNGGAAGTGLLPAGAGGHGGIASVTPMDGQPGADYGGGGGGARPGSGQPFGAGGTGFVRLVFKEKAT